MIGKDVESLREVLVFGLREPNSPKLNTIRCFRQECETAKVLLEGMEDHLASVKARVAAEEIIETEVVNAEENQNCSICLQEPPSIPCDWNTICIPSFHRGCLEPYFCSCLIRATCPNCCVPIIEEDSLITRVQNEDSRVTWLECTTAIEDAPSKLNYYTYWIEDPINMCSRVIRTCDEGGEEVQDFKDLLEEVEASQLTS